MGDAVDVLVVGSGAGGAAVAWALAPTGLRVRVLERGHRVPREAANADPAVVHGEQRYRTTDRWFDAAGEPFLPLHHHCLGGNTKFYGGAMVRLRPADFDAWPLAYDDVEPWYRRAELLYGVRGAPGVEPVPHEPRIARLADELRAAGLDPVPTPLALLRDDAGPTVERPCIRCATCGGHPCPHGGKGDAEVRCLEPAAAFPNVEIRPGTRVTGLEVDGRRVVAVEAGGERHEAAVVVLACGAIDTAALLLATGVANSSGQVGRNLLWHTTSSMVAFTDEPHGTVFPKTLMLTDLHEHPAARPGTPPGAVQLLTRSNAVSLAVDLPGTDPARLADLAARSLDAYFITEDAPHPDGRVWLDGDRVHVHHEHTDLDGHRRLVEVWQRLLPDLGCVPEPTIWRPPPPRPGAPFLDTTHQCGTARMGDDASTSVVGPDGRAHDVDNLYVADASVFASSGIANPALTVVALALRTAAGIASALGPR